MNNQGKWQSYCAACKKKTDTLWRDQTAYCASCGRSHAEMAAEGLNTAGPWDECPKCQTRHFYALRDGQLFCETCGLTKEAAQAIDQSRPCLISYRPEHVTSGSLLEIQYYAERASLPVLLSVSWLPRHGHTSIRLLANELPQDELISRISIDIPLGARSAIVIDPSGRSRRCEIPIEFESTPVKKPGIIKRLLRFE